MTPSHATGPAPAGSLAPRRRGAWARLPAAWRQRLVLVGLIGLALVPLAYVLERSAPGRLNIVYWDEFDTALRLAVKLHEGQPVGAFLQDLVAINNEHRMVTSRLLFAVLYWTTGTIDFGVVGSIGVGSLIVLVVLLAATAGTAARGVRLAVLLAFLLFQLEHYENFLWSGASIDHFTVVLLLGAAVVGLARGGTAGLVAAGVAGTAATYTLAHGLVIWPLGALLLFLTPGRRELLPWLALSVVVVGTYFTGFKVNPSQSFVAFGPDGRLAVDEMNRYWTLNGRPELRLPPMSEFALGVGQGSVFISRNASGQIDSSVVPDAIETPRDNATNNRVIVSSLTGRSRILKPVLR